MFGSQALEVGLGLLFVYLLLSLAVTSGTEIIAAVLRLRARVLRNGLINFLKNDTAGVSKRLRHTFGSFEKHAPEWVQDIYQHPLIKTLSASKHGPSYVPARTFALVLLNVVKQDLDENASSASTSPPSGASTTSNPPGAYTPEVTRLLDGLKQLEAPSSPDAKNENRTITANLHQALHTLAEEARMDLQLVTDGAGSVDLAQLREKIEVWFNNAMDQVSGWYKRWAKVISLIVAALITVGSNADTIQIVQALSNDDALRQALVAQAEVFAQRDSLTAVPAGQPPAQTPTPDTTVAAATPTPADTSALGEVSQAVTNFQETVREIRSLGLPLGWQRADARPSGLSGWFTKIIGLLLTTLALTLGAPFWFDVLKKVVNIRADATSPTEVPRSPEAHPKRPENVPPE